MAEQVPGPGVQKVFRAQRHDAWTLVAEVVANSLGAMRGQAKRVDIYHSARQRTLAILDDGRGFGYPLTDGRGNAGIGLLFKLGEGAGLSSGDDDDLGQFGAGGSIFLLNLADEAELWSLQANGEIAHTRQSVHRVVDIENRYFDVVDDWEQSTLNNTPTELANNRHGTLILIGIRKGKHVSPSVIQKYLSRHFAESLRRGRAIVWHDVDADEETRLAPWDPGELGYSSEADIEVHGLRAHVRAAYAPAVTEREAGIELVFGTQTLTITKEPFGTYTGGKLYGWVYLKSSDWRDQLNADKTGLHNDDLYEALMQAVEAAIADVVAFVEEADVEEWAADLALEASIQFGPIAKKLVEGFEEDTSKWEANDPPRRWKKRKKAEGDAETEEHTGIPIKVVGDKSGELGRFVKVDIYVGDKVVVRFDATAAVMVEARKPMNRPFYRYVVTDEFAAELVRRELVVPAGLFTETDWEQQRSDAKGDLLMLTAFVKPRLYDRVHIGKAS